MDIFKSLKEKRNHSSIEEEQWLFISNNTGLYAVDCAAPRSISLGMNYGHHQRQGVVSLASAKHLGLVALLMSDGTVRVGNPITGGWKSIQLLKVSFKLVGISIASAPCSSFKLCCLYQSGTSTLCTRVYSSRSRQWTEGASFSCDRDRHSSWDCTTDGEKMYAFKQSCTFSIVSYDISTNEWETMALGLPFTHGKWMSFRCNHGDNYPTMVVCNHVAYWVGRDSSHEFLKVYRIDQVAQKFELVGELQTSCSNCTMKYASDGAAHIYVLKGMQLLRFNLNSRRWRMYTLTTNDGNGFWFQVECMAVVTLAGGEMPVPVDIPRSGSNKLLHLVLSGVEETALVAPMGVAVNAEDETDIVKLNRPLCLTCNSDRYNPPVSWVPAATLEGLGLFCVLHEHACRRTQIRRMVCFPDSILVGNPLDTLERAVETMLGRVLPQHLVGLICKMTNEDLSQGCFQEIPMFEMDHMEEAKKETHDDQYDMELYANEFVGVAMVRHPTSTHDYLVCCFYRRKRIIHSQVYDSVSKQWKQGATQEVEGEWALRNRHNGGLTEVFRYGWRCDFTSRDGKAYVYSSELCYSVALYRKHLLRLFSYDILGDKWEVVVKNMEFPSHMLQTCRKGRGMILVECCEQLFVVAKNESGMYVEVRKLDLEHEELKWVAVLEARGEICATADNDKGKIFVSSSEPASSLHKSRVMAYDVHADEWSEVHVDHPNGGVYHMVMAQLKQPEY